MNACAQLLRIVVHKADRVEAELGIGAHLFDDQRARVAGADDQHAAGRRRHLRPAGPQVVEAQAEADATDGQQHQQRVDEGDRAGETASHGPAFADAQRRDPDAEHDDDDDHRAHQNSGGDLHQFLDARVAPVAAVELEPIEDNQSDDQRHHCKEHQRGGKALHGRHAVDTQKECDRRGDTQNHEVQQQKVAVANVQHRRRCFAHSCAVTVPRSLARVRPVLFCWRVIGCFVMRCHTACCPERACWQSTIAPVPLQTYPRERIQISEITGSRNKVDWGAADCLSLPAGGFRNLAAADSIVWFG